MVKTIPFDDDYRPIGNVPPVVPTVPGLYIKKTVPGTTGPIGAYVADQTCYVKVLARTVVRLIYSAIRLGKAQARVELHVNGQRVVRGDDVSSTNMDPFTNHETYPFSVSVTQDRLLLRAGDELTAVVVISGVGQAPIDKFGYRVFADTVFKLVTGPVPVDKFEVEVLEEIPPVGRCI